MVKAAFGDSIKRIEEDEDMIKAEQNNQLLLSRLKEEPLLSTKKVKVEAPTNPAKNIIPKVGVQVKTVMKKESTTSTVKKDTQEQKPSPGLLNILGTYVDSSSDSD